jgi:hypothetical protein
VQQVADGLGVAGQVLGDAWWGPAGIGQQDHFQAVAHAGRQRGAAERLQFRTNDLVELGV